MLPVLTVVAGILAIWYGFAVYLNADWARDQAGRDGVALTPAALVAATMAQERIVPLPELPEDEDAPYFSLIIVPGQGRRV